jgi:ribosomal protein S18 acetylase RimI-like enzyme
MTPTPPVLRPVSAADADALAALRVQAMRPSLEAVGRFDEARARRRFLDTFDAAWTREIAVAGRRVGFVVVRPVDAHWRLDHLYVQPEDQGAGIGSAVLHRVMEEAACAGKDLRLGALKGSAANAFYARHGFVRESESEWDCHYVLRHRRDA